MFMIGRNDRKLFYVVFGINCKKKKKNEKSNKSGKSFIFDD